MRRLIVALSGGIALLAAAPRAWSADDKKPQLTTHQLFKSSHLPHAKSDFSMFHFVPRGDKMMTEPEHGRLLFRTKDGQPDGFAERRGGAIVYYSPQGKAIRVQRLTSDELERLNAN